MTKMLIDRALLEQALEALVARGQRGDGAPDTVAALRAALAQEERPCSCRWVNDTQTQECTFHRITKESAHYWAERAKMAEAKVAALEQQDLQKRGQDDRYFTVVYKDIASGDEARSLGAHPKAVALSWSHALHDRDKALAALAQEEQEPYCYIYEYDSAFGLHREFYPGPYNGKQKPDRAVPVYTAPPRREQEQEPVAWRSKNATPPGGFVIFQQYPQALANLGEAIESLYTAPPRREWRSLSEEEIYSHWYSTDWRESVFVRLPAFARAIEKALKEKNHE